MNDEELRKYVKEEFVNSGFISVNQWRNFIDYLQILLKNKEKEMQGQINMLIKGQDNLVKENNELAEKIIDLTKQFIDKEKEMLDDEIKFLSYFYPRQNTLYLKDKIGKRLSNLKERRKEIK